MTLEEAQEQILQLREENTALTNERDTLSQNNEQLQKELSDVRTLNQKYFEKLTAQFSPQNDEVEQEENIPSCEEFAKTLTI